MNFKMYGAKLSAMVCHIHDVDDVEPQAKQLQEEGPEVSFNR